MIIGICGNSGSGKTTLSKTIEKLIPENSIHLDIDKIGHLVLTIDEVKKELIKCFGENVIKEGNIDRKYLGDLVFNSRDKMESLTNITWKYMGMEIDKFLNINKDKIIILDWILLRDTKYFEMCDIKILLSVPYEIRKTRAMKRDNITESAFDTREKASITYNKEDFDYCIEDYTEETIKRMVLKKWQVYYTQEVLTL